MAPNGGGLMIGSGGPKKQFASRAQAPAEPPQLESVVHAGIELLLTQWVPGPAPSVQSAGPVPALGPNVVGPVMARNEVAPSGILAPGAMVALLPPKYRQPRPRSTILVAQAVLESSSPDTGDAGGEVRPAGPQLVEPTVVVSLRVVKPPGMVVVVVVGGGTMVELVVVDVVVVVVTQTVCPA